MGTLQQNSTGEVVPIGSRCLVGRSPSADVRVDEVRVSNEHATISWTGAEWELRDLASKNGTFLGGRRLAPGERVALAEGDTFTLGGPATAFVLADASPPTARARHIQSGVMRAAVGGLLVLPDDDHPAVSVVQSRGGTWLIETGGEVRAALERETITVNNEGWALDIPGSAAPTLDADSSGPTLDTISLRFSVTSDEEYVEIVIAHAGTEINVPARNHHYMLLTLARARMGSGSAPKVSEGWLDRDELCRMLAFDENRLNVEVCRARKQFAALGLRDAANIIERRAGAGRLRLGVARVEVRRI